MNLRIEGQNLRFRISKEELESLCLGKEILQKTFLPGDNVILTGIYPEGKNTLETEFDKDGIKLFVQKEAANDLLGSLPNREGLEVEQKVGDNILKLSLEVDIRTQKRKRS